MSKFVGQSCNVLRGGGIVAIRRDKDDKPNFVTIDCDTLEVKTYATKELLHAAIEDMDWADHIAKRDSSRPATLVEQILDGPDEDAGPMPQQPPV